MLYKLKIFFLFILVFGFFTTCKKYPEDKRLSLKTVKQRLTKHDWYFTKFFINERDSTLSHLNYFTTSYYSDPRVLHFKIKPFAYGTDGSVVDFYIENQFQFGTAFRSTAFSLRDRKRNIHLALGYAPNDPNKNFWVENDIEWVIKKLTKTDFIIEKEFNNVKYRFEFKN